VRHLHQVAAAHGTRVTTVGPGAETVPLASSPTARLTAIVPRQWPHLCARDANDCSIGLRIDQCASSVLFVGDAQRSEENVLDVRGHVSLLQVGHHGSDTSTSDAFVSRIAPRYAVISAGKRGEGTNAAYCHPRRSVVDRLTAALGGPDGASVAVFDATGGCGKPDEDSHWLETKSSRNLWLTARDGDVALSSSGDGIFRRR
jgi:competence protein ComEC